MLDIVPEEVWSKDPTLVLPADFGAGLSAGAVSPGAPVAVGRYVDVCTGYGCVNLIDALAGRIVEQYDVATIFDHMSAEYQIGLPPAALAVGQAGELYVATGTGALCCITVRP